MRAAIKHAFNVDSYLAGWTDRRVKKYGVN